MCLGSLVTFSNLTSTLKIYMVENVLHERYTRVMVIKSYEIISSLKKIARILNLVCTFICIFVCIGKGKGKERWEPRVRNLCPAREHPLRSIAEAGENCLPFCQITRDKGSTLLASRVYSHNTRPTLLFSAVAIFPIISKCLLVCVEVSTVPQ